MESPIALNSGCDLGKTRQSWKGVARFLKASKEEENYYSLTSFIKSIRHLPPSAMRRLQDVCVEKDAQREIISTACKQRFNSAPNICPPQEYICFLTSRFPAPVFSTFFLHQDCTILDHTICRRPTPHLELPKCHFFQYVITLAMIQGQRHIY